MAAIVIDPRFNGFPNITLGGYVGGVLAHGRAQAEVTLRRPVQPGRRYEAVNEPDGTRTLRDGTDVMAVARDAPVDLEVQPAVTPEASRLASRRYVGHRRHLIPSCFNCGPLRAEGDGLRIFPGVVEEREVVAAPWTPAQSLANSEGIVEQEYVWSALDCPTIWALVLLGRPESEEKAVTARLAVDLVSPILAGRPHVVMGWKAGEQGRARVAGGAVYSADGHLLAKAKHTLVTTDWGVPLGLDCWK